MSDELRDIQRPAQWGVFIAAGILALRLTAYAMTGSLAVLADSIEPLFNLLAAAVTLLGVGAARRPADRGHPFGHHKLEFVAVGFHGAMALSGVIVVGGVGWFQWSRDWPVRPTPTAVGLFVGSIALSALLAAAQREAGRRHRSPALRAAARHARLDVLVGLAVLGSLLVAGAEAWQWVDFVVSVGVVVVVAYGALRLLRQALRGLMDTAAEELLERLAAGLDEAVEPPVIGYHDLRCRDAGGHVYLEFHLQFAPGTSLESAHDRAEAVEARLEAIAGDADATAHLEPADEVRDDAPLVVAEAGAGEQARRRAAARSLAVAVLLLAVKLAAWLVTGSAAVLSDALESVVNVAAAALALYSVMLARSGSDRDHPFGHHKVEFLAAGFEGALIVIAAAAIVWSAVHRLLGQAEPRNLGWGLALVLVAGGINALLGVYLVGAGRRLESVTLVADGRHVLADVWSSVAVVVGLVVVGTTGWQPADPLVALAVAGYILVTGAALLREALRGVLDTVDAAMLARAEAVLEAARHAGRIVGWHQLRVRDAGSYRFADAHIQLPPATSLRAAHEVSEQLEDELEAALAPAGAILHAEPHHEVRE